MDFAAFRAFVEANAEWCRGVRPETSESLAAAEAALGLPLPPTLKWLLSEWGYGRVGAVESLESAVELTLRLRLNRRLPSNYVFLMDWGDGGVVLLDCRGPEPDDWTVLWMGSHNVQRLAEGRSPDDDCDAFPGFGEWVANRLETAKDDDADGFE